MKLKSNSLQSKQVPIILVIEDNEDNLLFISHALIFLKYTFVAARNLEEARAIIERQQPALILLDIMLGKENGLSLVRQLKGNPRTKKIPIVAVTAITQQQECDRLLLEGCDRYLNKPYLLEDLQKIIAGYISKAAVNVQGLFPLMAFS
ncbi:response regulator [Myxosarcina sp. GI1]|uniref:response regulator n=1 Tax=Myxosarcina sp. GI1 TaxID=1541065 RepID=UPI00068A9C87|nr:response regulator [Myxosarcina sp. GI1]